MKPQCQEIHLPPLLITVCGQPGPFFIPSDLRLPLWVADGG